VAMGVAVPDEAHAPLAADPLPAGTEPGVAAGTSLTGLLDAAVSRRADVKAERLQESGAEFLLKGTQADLKPQVNLSLQAGYTGIYQDPRYNVLNVYDVTGYWRTFKGLYVGPSVQLTLTFDIPFKNNAAKGQYVQADALVGSAFITRKDLERTVRANIVDLEAALRSASAEVRSREAAARAGRELLSSGREQFRGGELSLLDTLVTEQTQTQAEADLVAARLMYASREARLRFETGTLLPYTILDGGVSFGPATPTGPLAGPKP